MPHSPELSKVNRRTFIIRALGTGAVVGGAAMGIGFPSRLAQAEVAPLEAAGDPSPIRLIAARNDYTPEQLEAFEAQKQEVDAWLGYVDQSISSLHSPGLSALWDNFIRYGQEPERFGTTRMLTTADVVIDSDDKTPLAEHTRQSVAAYFTSVQPSPRRIVSRIIIPVVGIRRAGVPTPDQTGVPIDPILSFAHVLQAADVERQLVREQLSNNPDADLNQMKPVIENREESGKRLLAAREVIKDIYENEIAPTLADTRFSESVIFKRTSNGPAGSA